jgi:hypothetical protein
MIRRPCEHCGGEIVPRSGRGRPRKYCSVACSRAMEKLRRQASVHAFTCARCGDGFTSTRRHRTLCTPCSTVRHHGSGRPPEREQARCEYCCLPFQRRANVGAANRQRYCSDGCWWSASSDRRRGRELTSVERALGLGDADLGAYYQVLRHDPCAYCGGPAGHIDHIEPRAFGGANHWGKYTAACQSCNASKGDKSLVGFLGWWQAAVAFDGWRGFVGNTSDALAGEASKAPGGGGSARLASSPVTPRPAARTKIPPESGAGPRDSTYGGLQVHR